MAAFYTTPAQTKWGHSEAALLFFLAMSAAILFTYLPNGQHAEDAEPKRYTVICGLRC